MSSFCFFTNLDVDPVKVNITRNPAFTDDAIYVNCEINGISYSSYEIIYNHTDVVSINQGYLIEFMNETHKGLYTCIAKTKFGQTYPSDDVYLRFFKGKN